MGSGLFVFLFIASAVLNNGASLGGGTSTAEQLAEKGQFGAAVNALASDAAKQRADSASTAPAPVAGAPSAAASQSSRSSATGGSPTPATAFVPPPDTGVGAGTVTDRFGPPPQLFLLVAVLFAIAAFVAHRRLHPA
jgi:hypothetical protein